MTNRDLSSHMFFKQPNKFFFLFVTFSFSYLIIREGPEAVSEIHYFTSWSAATLPNNFQSSKVCSPLSEKQIPVRLQAMRPCEWWPPSVNSCSLWSHAVLSNHCSSRWLTSSFWPHVFLIFILLLFFFFPFPFSFSAFTLIFIPCRKLHPIFSWKIINWHPIILIQFFRKKKINK